MQTDKMPEPWAGIAARGRVTSEDVQHLRRNIYGIDGLADEHEAEMMFRLNEQVCNCDRAWRDIFIEVLTDHLLFRRPPHGYVSREGADWLIARMAHNDRLNTSLELELLVTLLDKAKGSPEALVAYALDQVRRGVVEGSGPVRNGLSLEAGVIGKAEVDMIRRILFAFGGDGNVSITRAEADVLFDLNDAVADANNHPAWGDLFVKAIANNLMAASGYLVPSREEALRREKWLEERSGAGGFLMQALSTGLRGIWEAYTRPSQTQECEATLSLKAAKSVVAQKVSEPEAEWLAARITRDGHIHDNEKALLSFLKEESPDIHPALKPLLDRVA